MTQIDHRIQATTEEIVGHLGVLKLPGFDSDRYSFWEFCSSQIPLNPLLHQPRQCFAGLTKEVSNCSTIHQAANMKELLPHYEQVAMQTPTVERVVLLGQNRYPAPIPHYSEECAALSGDRIASEQP
ncbi:hypothetical protein [Burkholderia sp. MS455]|uniref:hypothetical protein n=1 Tax=Burkholderia sp. MS455 TaxID=2811788 RepID=UPI001EF414BE|nr:hypothetical protein [Burkholderia sp. MS455]